MHKEFKFHFEFSLEGFIKGFLAGVCVVAIITSICHLFGFIEHGISSTICNVFFLIYIIRHSLYSSEGILTKKEEQPKL